MGNENSGAFLQALVPLSATARSIAIDMARLIHTDQAALEIRAIAFSPDTEGDVRVDVWAATHNGMFHHSGLARPTEKSDATGLRTDVAVSPGNPVPVSRPVRERDFDQFAIPAQVEASPVVQGEAAQIEYINIWLQRRADAAGTGIFIGAEADALFNLSFDASVNVATRNDHSADGGFGAF